MKIAVVTDSASNIANENISMSGIYWVPLQIADGNDVYLESETASVADIVGLLKQKKVLMTSLPPLGRIEELFMRLKQEGYDMIFAVCVTKGLSSTIDAMITAAQQIDIPMEFIDCYSTACLQLHLAVSARIMFDAGKSVEEVKKALQKSIDDSCTYIIADDMKHLARSGRLSPVSATFAGLLKIKPILYLDQSTEGKIVAISKTRTMAKAMAELVNLYVEKGVGEGYRVYVAHVDNLEGAKLMYRLLKEKLENVEICIIDLISTISVHTGIGCVASQYIKLVDTE